MKIFSERLKKCRIDLGYTQTQMATLLSVKQQSYARYENCKGEPSLEMLVKIAKILDEDVNYLLGIS